MRILILGGTSEASMLARMLAGDPRFYTTLSLAGVTDAPTKPPVRLRIGGFGGAAGLASYILADPVDALVDATHPFAARISRNAQLAADQAGVPRLVVDRPKWQQRPGDRWTGVADMEQAANALGPVCRRVLLTVGRKDLAPFAARPWHRYVVRSVDPPGEAAPPGAEIITARGPFEFTDEMRLLQARNVEMIVTKNSGGAATYAKLAAGHKLGIEVVIVARPAPPDGEMVGDAAGAWRWLEHLHQAALAPRGV